MTINKSITFFLIIIFFTKIIIWFLYDSPISRVSMLIILALLIVLNFHTKAMWFIGIIIFCMGLSYKYWPLKFAHINPFNFTESITTPYSIKSNNIYNDLFITLPFFLYIFLFAIFFTRKYKKKYGLIDD